jgi:hypothetical protein
VRLDAVHALLQHRARAQGRHASTEEDALHGAALVIRGGQHPWLIEGPGVHLEPQEIVKRCEPILKLFKRSAGERR